MRLRDLLLGSAMALALGGAAVAAPAGIVIQPGGNGSGSVTSVGCPSGVITTSGNCLPLTVAGVAGDVVTAAGANGVQDSGTLLTALAPKASPTFTGTVDIPALDLTAITGSTQCLHVNTSGVVSGVGSDCGAGGGVTSLTATSPLTGGVITTTGSIGLPAPLAGATANYTAHGVLFGEGSASALAASAAGTAGQFLLSGGASADPAFSSLASLTSSGLFMAGATGGGEGVDTVNAKNFYQMGSLIQVVPFSSSCTPPACTYTLPGITDTLLGAGTVETITAAYTFTPAPTFSGGINLGNNTGIVTGAAGAPELFFDDTMPLNRFAFFYAPTFAGNTMLGIGSNGSTFTGTSTVAGGISFDETINQSSTAGWYFIRCAPTLTAGGSGIANCYDVNIGGSSKWSVDKAGNTNLAGAAAALEFGGAIAIENVTPTCSATGGSPTCTVNAHSGSLAFKVTLGAASSATTITITPGYTAANGFVCTANDNTTSTERLFQNTALSATTCTLTFFNAAGTATSPGATDVISGIAVGM
jgi:hypothetical protein